MANELYVDVDAMRKFISKLLAIAQVTAEMPDFLHGQNKQGFSIELTRRDLGDYDPFHVEYRKLVGWRFEEVRQFDRYLWMTVRKLAWGLSKILEEDVEIGAHFTNERHDLLDVVRQNGMDLKDSSRPVVHGSRDGATPNESDDRIRRRNVSED